MPFQVIFKEAVKSFSSGEEHTCYGMFWDQDRGDILGIFHTGYKWVAVSCAFFKPMED